MDERRKAAPRALATEGGGSPPSEGGAATGPQIELSAIGAPLSHAAIVARELGSPAVVGCGNATMLLKTGDRVQVDGSAGTVTLV